jgi:glycosyltransferase involved in cell wall biosynthesis
VIYNGIADEFFSAPPDARDPKLVGAVMRLSAIKNPAALGKVARALAPRGTRVELVTDTTRARPALLQAVAGVQVVAPTTSTAALAAFYSRCRAIVCPSRFEASGNVPMEALAAGVPAVITSRMGIAELFRDLGLGNLVVDVDDIGATVDRLESAEPIGDDLRRRLQDEFRWPVVAERVIGAL